MVRLWILLGVFSLLLGCTSAAQHRAAVQEPVGGELTVGTVQKEIRVGMSSAEVAAAPVAAWDREATALMRAPPAPARKR